MPGDDVAYALCDTLVSRVIARGLKLAGGPIAHEWPHEPVGVEVGVEAAPPTSA